MKTKLISVTKPLSPEFANMTSEELIVAIARVSNPSNQTNTATTPKLIKYCLENKHWSPFEMVDLTLEIETSRAIAPQILRHKSLNFQEFSQRYSRANTFEPVELRKQAVVNRQSSEEIVEGSKLGTGVVYIGNSASEDISDLLDYSHKLYNRLINSGVSKETARMILPLCTTTTLYAKGSVRSWLTYLNLRLNKHTQKEHRLIAEGIRDIFIEQFPIISSVFDNFSTAYEEHFIK